MDDIVLKYNNVDIASKIKILNAEYVDVCGDKSGSLNIIFSDVDKSWRDWGPKRGDVLELILNSTTSGKMNIDEKIITPGKYMLKAISIPINCKTKKSCTWENIRFDEVAKQLSNELNLELKIYGITNYLYYRLEMIEESNLEFLNKLCILEGYSLKIFNSKLIIYNEKYLESLNSVITLYESDLGSNYEFKEVGNIYSECELKFFSKENKLIKGIFKDTNVIGTRYISRVNANTQEEANRWSKGIIRNINKNRITGKFSIPLNPNIAAGSTILLKGISEFSGKYFVNQLTNNLISNKSYILARKIVGDY